MYREDIGNKFIATTYFGLEKELEKEIHDLGFKNIKIMNRAVSFTGGLKEMYKANYSLRTALRILYPIASFSAINEDKLYSRVKDTQWDLFIDNSMTLAIDSVVNSTYFRHTKYPALKTKDAIVDQMREKTGLRPSVDTKNPDLRLNLHIAQDKCTICLDSSSIPLYRRGYKVSNHNAQISEVLAAGIVAYSGWDGSKELVDPMCGSGTLLIEAAMKATQTPPGKFREFFGFMKWKDFDSKLFEEVKAEMAKAENKSNLSIRGSDISIDSVRMARENLESSGFGDTVSVRPIQFNDTTANDLGGVIITNLPYDQRLKLSDVKAFYREVGDKLKNDYQGYTAWLFSGNQEGLKNLGLRPAFSRDFMNGPIECKLAKYEINKRRKA